MRPECSSIPSRPTWVGGDVKVEGHHPVVRASVVSVASLSLKETSQSGYIERSDEAEILKAAKQP
jgi:hypothetical protein